tara:strand:+ start:11113 stop:11460 length:348 start_codon:yes stop_codon:yes gene_type:complete
MSKGMRSSKKPTIRQLGEQVKYMDEEINRLSQFLNDELKACKEVLHRFFLELDKSNIVVLAMLENDGKLERVECGSCELINNIPLLDGLEQDKTCGHCGEDMNPEQKSLEDFEEE